MTDFVVAISRREHATTRGARPFSAVIPCFGYADALTIAEALRQVHDLQVEVCVRIWDTQKTRKVTLTLAELEHVMHDVTAFTNDSGNRPGIKMARTT